MVPATDVIVYFLSMQFLVFHFCIAINEEIAFLEQFGYLEVGNGNAMSLRSESSIKKALMEMQRVARIPVTGEIDSNTKMLLRKARCGLKDTETLRLPLRQKRRHRHRSGQRVRRYVLQLKWEKLNVTYSHFHHCILFSLLLLDKRVALIGLALTEQGQLLRCQCLLSIFGIFMCPNNAEGQLLNQR
ncbi:putative peptidoglycan binding domain-containing protein [Ditylenchus destructor]|uniref:Peptidoglycan binding domain-containing protein n=1 Tax=Ditylenchus destructor TaxID=166010 RepID=A0AAD4NM74_9BILA|nr:putative peptidoglycan binding domain-containing protein [Ditylenchus destructor]